MPLGRDNFQDGHDAFIPQSMGSNPAPSCSRGISKKPNSPIRANITAHRIQVAKAPPYKKFEHRLWYQWQYFLKHALGKSLPPAFMLAEISKALNLRIWMSASTLWQAVIIFIRNYWSFLVQIQRLLHGWPIAFTYSKGFLILMLYNCSSHSCKVHHF